MKLQYIRLCTDLRRSFDVNVYIQSKFWSYIRLCTDVQKGHLMWMYCIYKVSLEVILGSVQTCEDHLRWMYKHSKFGSYISLCADLRRSFEVNVYTKYVLKLYYALYRLAKFIWCDCIYKVSFEVILGSVQTCKDHLMWLCIQNKFWSYIRLCTDLRKSFNVNVYTK